MTTEEMTSLYDIKRHGERWAMILAQLVEAGAVKLSDVQRAADTLRDMEAGDLADLVDVHPV